MATYVSVTIINRISATLGEGRPVAASRGPEPVDGRQRVNLPSALCLPPLIPPHASTPSISSIPTDAKGKFVELTAAATFLGATATDQTNPLSARKHEFDYDGIGNRKWSNTSGNSSLRDDYTVNELNQYTVKENNTLAVGGTVASDSASLKVAAGSTAAALAGRKGRHWGDNITVENFYTPFQGNLAIYAVNTSTNTKMTDVRTAFLPQATQTMSYDEDGNILNDGVWTYEWDAENRLRAMQTTANAAAGGVPTQRLEFKYDYLHRRVEKLVRGGWNGSYFTTVTSQKRFLYDGWSLIAEYSVSGSTLSLVRSYTWGLDIAKSLTDAGGVGALLQIHDYAGSGKDYLPSYDGNGNIAALFDADASSSATACVAAYEYSPYGEFLRCEGAYAKENPFRFSTKFTDDESGLVYYGRRYYSPSQGRFLGRDPKFEMGGRYARKPENPDALHLYAMCRNNAINRWDYLGMYTNGVTFDGLPNPFPDDNGYSGINPPPDPQWPVVIVDPTTNLTLTSPTGRVDNYKSLVVPASFGGRVGIGYYPGNLIHDPEKTMQDVKDLVAFLKDNSPTFKKAYDAIVGGSRTYVVNIVEGTSGGAVDDNRNIVFGTQSAVRSDGSIIYPSYTLAHEFGHVSQSLGGDAAHPEWNVSITSSSDPKAAIAPNSAEYYALQFANQVSSEILQNTGLNIGSQARYNDTRNSSTDNLGFLPPKK